MNEQDNANNSSYDKGSDLSRRRWRKVIALLVTLALLITIGFGAYWFLSRSADKSSDGIGPGSNMKQQSSEPENTQTTINTKTKHHISTGFSLEFDYPEDWTVTEATDKGRLDLVSPALRLKEASGRKVLAQVAFTIRNKQQPQPEFDKGNAVAVRESEKIAYTRPSSVQRGSTYLSFLQYASSTQPGGLDGVFITGDVGYKVGQAIPKADFVPVDPVVSVTFLTCVNSSCSGEGSPLGITTTMWEDVSFGKPIKSIFQSMIIN